MKARNTLYWLAQIMGDVNSAKKGTVLLRIQRRAMGRFTGKTLMRKLVKRGPK